ncbi:MAG: alpha/beta hydrolase family protein, partial [Gammaproteobacteria bacterium]
MPFCRLLLLLCLLLPPGVLGDTARAPSVPGVDAPELAAPGAQAVGVRTLTLRQRDQANVLGWAPAKGPLPREDRVLVVDLWYPAASAGGPPESYEAALDAEPPNPPARFTVPGIAVRDAPVLAGAYPLVVVSHGYGNVSAGFTWLSENLASKGYVVAVIRHEDPPITDRSGFPQLLLRRPLDIAFVAAELRGRLAEANTIDPSRVALVGYSMGGYGVLTAGGGTLDPQSPLAAL